MSRHRRGTDPTQPGPPPRPGGPGASSGAGAGGERRRPQVWLLALGLVGLVVAGLSLLHQLAGVGADGRWVAPTAALAAGGVFVVVGLVGLLTRR
ncbi:hypothetical protein BJY21_002986 [Kineosphaera limosa]|uniref:Uncharacterized protein n=1 Tax=Kineosphaera limosa NBRC 100340 TaxID=1184609 RepID=K6VMC2_9MICO|nr:hypothetical protein [Kineosphaera limosa]NYE01802.1 hypothetical protein [Kineosphaera limosa]GAB97353.1 hypothetical protein KILIM_065_00310 [Kineosphaera limosa NBRC 100340]